MKTLIFLIATGFIQFVLCNIKYNISDYDSYPVCPITFLRQKRAHTEYTRWRADQESTPEFLVKVLDEELTTSTIKQIIAVNIQPITKGGEKIIVGGAMVPPPTSLTTQSDPMRDYTRFVPPTTVAISHVDGDMYLAPAPLSKSADKISSLPLRGLPMARHSLRDDSPPASPQFLARTPLLSARQYAPIIPVAFTPRTTVTPLTPPTQRPYNPRKAFLPLSRTTSFRDMNVPTRTESDFQNTHSIDNEYTTEIAYLPKHTSIQQNIAKESSYTDLEYSSTSEIVWHTTRTSKSDDDESIFNKIKEKDIDTAYSMMFYNDEDNESPSKKDDIDASDNYEDKIKLHNDSTEMESNELLSETTKFQNITPPENILPNDDQEKEEDDEIKTTESETHFIKATITTLHTTVAVKEKEKAKKSSICSVIKLRQLSFNSPRTLPEIVVQMRQWAEESPIAKWTDITSGNYTVMENPIYMMMVDDPSSGQIVTAKQTVMIVAGIQGRDHHAVAAAMYVLYQLIERTDAHADLLKRYRFWIIPVFNPDGYDYSMTFSQKRGWTKNLRQTWDVCKGRESCYACEAYGLRCTVQHCYGVNLDRNFEYQWIPAEELRAEHPCGALYAGTRQLSEAETRALTQFLHEQRTPLYTFIAFKEGDVLGVMYPYSHTRKKRAFDHVYRQRASSAAAAAYSISGRSYVAGQTSEFLPLYAGGIEDWVDGHLGIDNTYTIMMFRPTDAYNSKLITERVVHEAYAAMDTLLLQSVEPLGPPVLTITRARSTTTESSMHLVLLISITVTVSYS
ncbi:putative metallocarboxypeptidase ecm14 isoform X1 [Manduca sexta]|uniref:putative metallocarboxypeptidase ecm14 isoform X1 n=1 Tax=Manduca sexta TaxID=7130 RepID=UPI001890B1BE|nr:putative metallocarboxypeptidase ecm14 isoform X1 [Manduca sexta]